MGAFGALCHQNGCRPNARLFFYNFKLSKAPYDDECGLYAFSSTQNNVFLRGLTSKVDNFRKRWCWVSGPGILFNPEWRVPASNITIHHYEPEVELGAKIEKWMVSGDDFKVTDLIVPEALTAAGVITPVSPFVSPSSSSEHNSSDRQPSDHQSSNSPSSDPSSSSTSGTSYSIFDILSPQPETSSPYRPIPPSSHPTADSNSGASTAHQDEAPGETYEDVDIDVDINYDIDIEGFDDPSLPAQEEAGGSASVEAEAPDMPPKATKKVFRVPPPMLEIPRQKSAREEGEIAGPPNATKRPRTGEDEPPREVATASQPPAKLKAFASRSAPGLVETFVRGAGPSATLTNKPLKKRLSSNYQPAYPAALFRSPDYTVSAPEPKI
ncbi:hypothetical protein Dimus_001313 [Dionaea muscipula]